MIFSEISYKNKQIKSEETFNQLTTKHEKYINSLSRFFLSSIVVKWTWNRYIQLNDDDDWIILINLHQITLRWVKFESISSKPCFLGCLSVCPMSTFSTFTPKPLDKSHLNLAYIFRWRKIKIVKIKYLHFAKE